MKTEKDVTKLPGRLDDLDSNLSSWMNESIDSGESALYLPRSSTSDLFGSAAAFAQASRHASFSLDNAPLYLASDDGISLVGGASSQDARPWAHTSVAGAATTTTTTSTTTTSTTTSTTAATLVGAAGGLQFDLVWDSSVSAAPAGFKNAAIAAATKFTRNFSVPERITLHVGYGEVNGSAIGSGALARSQSYGVYETYSQLRAGLLTDASASSYQSKADATLPTTDPTNGGKFFVTTAEQKAMGQASGTGLDGFVGLSSAYSWDFNAPTTPVAAGQYDAIGTLAHEFSEVMGRYGSVGKMFGSGVYTALDMFRYSGANVRDLTVGPTAPYFSINKGLTKLDTFNNPANGADAGDWASPLVGDSFGYGYAGHTSTVSATDVLAVGVLGYKLNAAGVSSVQTLGLA